MLHRDGGPAVEYDDGSWEWRRHGLLHRDDGPAVYLSAGREEWSADDRLAWGHADETELWFRDGRLHREDEPAVIERGTWSAVTRGEHYYRDGKLDRSDGPAFYREYSDEPALEMWFRAGALHRSDGPAQRFGDGREAWLLSGQLHREDGPAVVVPGDVRGEFALDELTETIPAGTELYYLDGERLSREEWSQRGARRPAIKPRSG